jgi:hypothetical protein
MKVLVTGARLVGRAVVAALARTATRFARGPPRAGAAVPASVAVALLAISPSRSTAPPRPHRCRVHLAGIAAGSGIAEER